MKKLFTYCLAILFATQLMAQISNESINPRNIENQYNLKLKNKRLIKPFSRTNIHEINSNTLMGKKGISEKLDSAVVENYSGGKWSIEDYKTFQFDEKGKMISYYFYQWDGLNKFDKNKTEYSYDANGNLTTKSYFEFSDNKWIFNSKSEIEYNTDGNISKETFSSYNFKISKWEVSSKSQYDYDGNKNLLKITSYMWDTNIWTNSNKQENEYDGNNNLIKSTFLEWNEGIKDWENSFKMEMTYNNDGNPATNISQSWSSNMWENQSKQTFTYDANKNLSELLNGSWDILGMEWIDKYKNETTYDLNVSIDDVLFPKEVFGFEEFIINNKVITSTSSELVGSNWELTDKEIYYYSPFYLAGINKTNFVSTNVYPNPAKDLVNFDLSQIPSATEILIFDMNGKQVLNHSILNGNQIDVSQLSKGFYLYKIIGNENISTGKLIVE